MSKYIQKGCDFCSDGKVNFQVGDVVLPCRYCGGTIEQPTEEGLDIIRLIRRFNKYPYNTL